MQTVRVSLQQTLDEAFEAFAAGDLPRTEAKCREVLGVAPRAHDAWNLMGAALHRSGRIVEAGRCFQEAIALQPDNPEPKSNLAAALLDLKLFGEGLTVAEAALAQAPDLQSAIRNRDLALASLDKPDVFGEAAARAQRLCDWPRLDRLRSEFEKRRGKAVYAPGVFLAFSDDPAVHRAGAEAYVAAKAPERPALFKSGSEAGRKIRLAYLSADFRRHAVGFLFEEVLSRHDREPFEVHGISFGDDDGSDVRRRLADGFDAFHDVSRLTDRGAAQLIADLGADIAVDLMGHTYQARLGILSHRPAPVQVAYMGYPATTGAPYIDHIIADPVVLPLEEQPHYSEKIIHLKDCYLSGGARRAVSAPPSRADLGLPAGATVFCCFNAGWKIRPTTFDVWVRILKRVENSVLWLSFDNERAEANLRREAQARGVDGARLVFKQRVGFDQHLAQHALADLFLDTLPYNAHATAADALWTGLPLLTTPGSTFAGRVAASALTSAGVPELIAPDPAAYEDAAVALAGSPDRRADIRNRLIQARDTSPLFDTQRHVRDLESLFHRLWRNQSEEA